MRTDSELRSLSRVTTTTSSFKSKRGGVASVVVNLLKANGTQSITITRQGTSEDFSVSCVIVESSGLDQQPSLFELLPT